MERPIDQIETELMAAADRRSAADGEIVRLIRELDMAQVVSVDAARSLTEWVSSRLDVDPDNARRLVDLARTDTPLDTALDAGMTVDRAAAVARLRSSGASEDTIGRSFGLDLLGLRRLVAAHRRIDRDTEIVTAESRYLHLQPSLDESSWRLWGLLTGVDGRTVEKAIRTEADSLPDDVDTTQGQANADALVSVCTAWLDGETAGSSSPTAEIFIDGTLATAYDGQQGVSVVTGPRVGPQVLEEILCSGTVNVTVAGSELRTVRSHGRSIPAATRAHVLQRDGHRCVIDGCRSRTRLQPHHLVPRADGGDHHPDNLATLCWFHHHIAIHQLGLRLDPDTPPQRRRFVRAADWSRDGP